MRAALPLFFVIASATPSWALQHHFSPSPGHTEWAAPSAITCETVRSYVSMLGIAQARAVARANGMTGTQERRARRCLSASLDGF
jgi:hypothetical protein